MEEADDKCPECGGEMRMESTAYGDYWTCSNENCDFSQNAEDMGDTFSEERYYELELGRELDGIVDKNFWIRSN